MSTILLQFRSYFIETDTCPECLGTLDEGRECNQCGHDILPEWEEYREYLSRRERLEDHS